VEYKRPGGRLAPKPSYKQLLKARQEAFAEQQRQLAARQRRVV